MVTSFLWSITIQSSFFRLKLWWSSLIRATETQDGGTSGTLTCPEPAGASTWSRQGRSWFTRPFYPCLASHDQFNSMMLWPRKYGNVRILWNDDNCWVVWNIAFIFPIQLGSCHHPNWRTHSIIFQRARFTTTNQRVYPIYIPFIGGMFNDYDSLNNGINPLVG